MNNRFKFRAFDEQNKIMHNDFQFIKSGDDGNDWILFTSDKQPISDYDTWIKNPYFQQQLKIMQFTGFKDKNRIEIYEGDFCANEDRIGYIRFDYGWAIDFGTHSHDMPPYYCERLVVIGNVYENPELLMNK